MILIPAGWTNENRQEEAPGNFIERMFPSLMNHLKSFENKAKNRYDQGDYWWELRHCIYYPEFEKEKVVWQELAVGSQFAYDNDNFFVTNTGYILTRYKLKYILGYLNSKLNEFAFEKWYCTKLGTKGTRWLHQHVMQLPIPPITSTNEQIVKQIEEQVDRMIDLHKRLAELGEKLTEERRRLIEQIAITDSKIDHLVYKLYDLTDEEINLIESKML